MLSYHIVCTTPQDGLNYVFWCGTFLRISTVNLLGIVIELKLSFFDEACFVSVLFSIFKETTGRHFEQKEKKKNKKFKEIYFYVFEGLNFFSLEWINCSTV